MLYNTVDEWLKVVVGIKIKSFFFCLFFFLQTKEHLGPFLFFPCGISAFQIQTRFCVLRNCSLIPSGFCKLWLNEKLPARHCVFKMDRFCVSGPSFPPAGHAAAAQNLSHKPFFLEIQSLPSWFGGLCFPNCSIDVLRVNGGTHACVPGDLGRIKGDQRRSGSKNLWFHFFFPPLSYNPKRKVLISKWLWFKLRLSQNVDVIDVRIVFWHLICIWDSWFVVAGSSGSLNVVDGIIPIIRGRLKIPCLNHV